MWSRGDLLYCGIVHSQQVLEDVETWELIALAQDTSTDFQNTFALTWRSFLILGFVEASELCSLTMVWVIIWSIVLGGMKAIVLVSSYRSKCLRVCILKREHSEIYFQLTFSISVCRICYGSWEWNRSTKEGVSIANPKLFSPESMMLKPGALAIVKRAVVVIRCDFKLDIRL